MAALNQAKIINALEKIVTEAKEDFIFSFLLAYGMPKATIKRLQMNDKQRNVAQIAGDVAVAQKIYFRPVSGGKSLQGSLDEIRALPLRAQHKIRFVMVTDFKTILAYDSKVDDFTEFDFSDFKTNFEFFLPLTGQYEKAVAYAEHPADVKACEKMGRLYDCIRAINHYERTELHTLNVFLTRLLFCFFAEDTGIFPKSNQMTHAVKSLTKEDGSDLTEFFETLFKALNLPDTAAERKSLSVTFQSFPYVNGGLFEEQCRIPKFDSKARRLLLDCGYMSWNDISPVIFGSMFQAVMDPEKRRSMGAHYTSEKNILKVVRPLFLDGLNEEFEQLLTLSAGKKKQALRDFQQKLAGLGFLDPACGCGNFLVVSYRELRELELKVLLAIRKDEPPQTQVIDVRLLSKVTINQFYGIELEEFPVEIARVSMWLMEHVMNLKFGDAFGMAFPSIPLQHSAEIVCANALTIPWEDIVASEKLNYILGNPPFSGARMMGSDSCQKSELKQVFNDLKGCENLDYVTAWFKKASEFFAGTSKEIAFVATNSICQGEQVGVLWKELFTRYEIRINFAYRTFKWENEAKGKAAIHCIIVGFSSGGHSGKILFSEEGIANRVTTISPYLTANSEAYIEAQKIPLSEIHKMNFGNQPRDGGHFILTDSEKNMLLEVEPSLVSWIRRYMGSEEFINNSARWCLWLKGISDEQIAESKILSERVAAVRDFRLASKAKTTNGYAKVPMQFAQITQPDNSNFLLIPRVSSERRKYVPIGFMNANIIASDAVQIVPNATYYDFAILTSSMHMTWMRTVCGRLEMRYRYSRDLCYNTFPWPTPTASQKKHIETLAENILLTREMYPDMTLADMYDPDKMPEPLRAAHTAQDLAVDALYRKKPFASDEERLQLLFAMYEKLVSKSPHAGAKSIDAEDESDDD